MTADGASRHSFRGLRATVGILLAASCGLVHGESAQLPASKLISQPQLKFLLDQRQSGNGQVTTLLHEDATGNRTEVAAIEFVESTGPPQFTVRSFAKSGDVAIGALERLYTLALRLDPEANFCFSLDRGECKWSKGRVDPHGDVLREIASAREKARADAAAPSASWRSVTMVSLESGSRDADLVSVRLSSAKAPLEGVNIYFTQAPHTACRAKTDTSGVATCRLVDLHGDEDEHVVEKHAVVAMFPGDIAAEPVLPPTTFIVRAGKS